MEGVNHDWMESAIAIVGMEGRYAGCPSLSELWETLASGKETLTDLSDEQLRQAGVTPQRWEAPGFVRRASLLQDVDMFDAEFFGMGPREAELTDPQQRQLLECAWAALEDAGIAPDSFEGPVGVYASSTLSKYLINNLLSHRDTHHTRDQFLSLVGNDKDYLATHIAYKLRLQGPALSVQTACSSSLVGTHLACQALLLHECDAALVGAASIRVPQTAGYQHLPGGIWSEDGHTRPFDSLATGTVFANGVVCVALMRLSDALARGHRVHAVIRGSAVNNDGDRKVGFTAPSVEGQAEVIAAALRASGVKPGQISYVEAHGTATPLGDPIEVAALDQAFRALGWREGTCHIGSIKGNLGHLDVAAGLTGLVKCALALSHRTLPASIQHVAPNPKIDFAATPFRVKTSTTPWGDDPHQPLFAGVSSFGIGGSNAHVVLQSAPPRQLDRAEASPEPQLIVMSARNEAALGQAVAQLEQCLKRHDAPDHADIAFTLAAGRTHMRTRTFAVLTPGIEGPGALIADLAAGIQPARQPNARNQRLILLFGDAPQVPRLADMPQALRCELMRHEQVVQKLWRCDLAGLLQTPHHPAAAMLHALGVAQLLQRSGAKIDALACAGSGELAAACFAGVLSVEEALRRLNGSFTVAASAQGAMSMAMPCWSAEIGAWLPASRASAWRDALPAAPRPVDRHAMVSALRQRFGGSLVLSVPNLQAATVPALTGPQPQSPDEWLPQPAPLEWASALRTLGQLWMEGALTRLDTLHAGANRRFVSLPTYRFQRTRHWIDAAAPTEAHSAVAQSAASAGDRPAQETTGTVRRAYLPVWTRLPLNRPAGPGAPWLLLGHDARFLDGLASALSTSAPSHLALLGALSPAELQADMARRLSSTAPVADLLLDLRALQAGPDATTVQLLTPLTVLQAVARACAEAGLSSWRLVAITQDGCQVLGTETCEPGAAAVTAALRVMNQERGSSCRIRQIDLPRDGNAGASVLAAVLEALAIDPDTPSLVAIRGRHAWRQDYRAAVLDNSTTPAFRQGGTYLITGGNGRLGRGLAALLRSRHDAKVILLGRSKVAPVDGAAMDTRHAHIQDALAQLPAWIQRIEAERPMVDLADFGSLQRDLELWCASRCWQALSDALPVALTSLSSRLDLDRQLQLLPVHGPFLDFILDCFVAEGWLHRDADRLEWTSADRAGSASTTCAELVARHPSFGGLVELIDHCASHLAAVLQGRQDPLRVLYADGSKSFLESKSERILDYGNLSQLKAALIRFVDQLADGRLGRPLRILEVGGGNGVLTRPLVEHLKGRQVDYTFTDIGRTFLLDAQRHAAANGIDFMSFKRLDISRDPIAQGFEAGGYDLVLALDVLHATPKVQESARHVRRLLAPGGALGLLELVKAHRWTHLLFGFLPGWWSAADAPLRRGYPLLSGVAWTGVLRDAGFGEVDVLPSGPQTGPRAEKVLAIARNTLPETDDAILSVQADVSNVQELGRAVDVARRRFGRIDGVLHAAATPGESGPLVQLSADAMARQAGPKLDGLRAIHQVFESDAPDFIASFSSLATVTGMPLNGAYCVANALMEAQACQPSGPTRSVVVAWDRWITSAGLDLYGVGEEAAAQASPAALQRMQETSLTIEEGLDLLGDVLGSGQQGMVAVSSTALDERIRRHESAQVDARIEPPPAQQPPADSDELEGPLLGIWSEVLGVREVTPEDDFFALGGDSLAALQMMNLVQTRMRIAVTVDELMTSQTVKGLAALLEAKRQSNAR